MNSLYGTTSGENLFQKVERILIQYSLNLNMLRCTEILIIKMCGEGRAELNIFTKLLKM